jgi:sugar/nucleoside kinase (ribokinase family)
VPAYDILMIGHITSDILNFKGDVTPFTGGATYFASYAAKTAGVKCGVLTKLAKKDFKAIEEMRKDGIEVIAIPSPLTTSIENIFETDDLDKRKVRLISQADPFYPGDLPEELVKTYYLGGLFVGEIPHELIEYVAKKGNVALDLQAMLRTSEKGKSFFRDWPEKMKYLPLVTYLKADSLEAEVATGTTDREKAAKMFYQWGAKEIVITHSSEVIVYDGEKIHRAPFNPKNLSGRTGRGDTCFGSYTSWRLRHGIEESVKLAAALTSIKMEKRGPFRGTLEDVFKRMEVS